MKKEQDTARNEHIAEIERLKEQDLLLIREFKRDKDLECRIRLLEKQLVAYDKAMGY